MALELGSLLSFVDEQREPLIGKAVLSAKTSKLLNLQTGVKGTTALNLLTNTTVFGNGAVCGWDEAGETTLSQRKLTVGAIKVNKSFCDKKMFQYWMGYKVKVAAGAKTLPFEDDFITAELASISQALEIAIWQGDVDSMNVNLNKFDGLIKLIDADTNVIPTVNTGITSITTNNVLQIIDSVFLNIPFEILDRPTTVIMVGADVFRLAIVALRNADLYHYKETLDGNMEVIIPGTSTKVIGVNGLNGTNRIFAFDANEVFYGTDLANDEEKFEFWYSQDNREFRLAVEFVAGVQYAYGDHIVEFHVEGGGE